MKIKNLKINNKILLFVLTGAIGFSETSCVSKEIMKHTFIEDTIDKQNSISKNKDILEKEEKKECIIVSDEYVYEYDCYGYIKKDTEMSKEKKLKVKKTKLSKYQKVKILSEGISYIKVKADGIKGYVNKDCIKKISTEFIDVDISNQKLKYYDEHGDVILSSDVVTGTLYSTQNRKTPYGLFKIYDKDYKRTLRGTNGDGTTYASNVDYWMPFYEGCGLHDANWRSSFGGTIYKYSGSHGCVNLPHSVASKIYQKSKIGTKVLVHE